MCNIITNKEKEPSSYPRDSCDSYSLELPTVLGEGAEIWIRKPLL